MKRTTPAKKSSRSNGLLKGRRPRSSHFAVCVSNRNYVAPLEPRKIYRVMRDAKAATLGLIRVVDESGDDYLYPENYFLQISLPDRVQRVLNAVS